MQNINNSFSEFANQPIDGVNTDTEANASIPSAQEDAIIKQALKILEKRLVKHDTCVSSPEAAKWYLILKLAMEEREIFGVLWLDVSNRVIACEDMFFGTLTQTSVYPREVVKSALKHNACAAIIYHNHPSGNTTPSEADKTITDIVQRALRLIEVRLHDHIIVGGSDAIGFAEQGLL
jgi:DNA repair protein RadC